jgi:hypothetical protein
MSEVLDLLLSSDYELAQRIINLTENIAHNAPNNSEL